MKKALHLKTHHPNLTMGKALDKRKLRDILQNPEKLINVMKNTERETAIDYKALRRYDI